MPVVLSSLEILNAEITVDVPDVVEIVIGDHSQYLDFGEIVNPAEIVTEVDTVEIDAADLFDVLHVEMQEGGAFTKSDLILALGITADDVAKAADFAEFLKAQGDDPAKYYRAS